jgi:hypothetical protein
MSSQNSPLNDKLFEHIEDGSIHDMTECLLMEIVSHINALYSDTQRQNLNI